MTRCSLAEYRAGKEHGYWVQWFPSGVLQSAGIMWNGYVRTGSYWHPNGSKSEIHVDGNQHNWDEAGIAIRANSGRGMSRHSSIEFKKPSGIENGTAAGSD